jgi:acyl-CoA synthetase (AMP-forming)/AMP-acid ligase II
MQVVDKPWFPDYPPTLPHVIHDCVAKHADRTFLIEGESQWTFRQIGERSARLARGLTALGVGKAHRVGIIMPNCTDWVVTWWAAGRIGAFTVPLSTFFRPRELAAVLKQADIETLLVYDAYLHHNYVEHLEEAIPELKGQDSTLLYLQSHPYLRRIVVWGRSDIDGYDRKWAIQGPDELHALADADRRIDAPLMKAIEDNVVPADMLIGVCTSGSTAEPKIVVHTHASMLRICHAYRAYMGIRPDDRSYSGMPFFWLGGLNFNLLQIMFEGACMVFAHTPKPDDVLNVVSREKVTRVSMWPAQRLALLDRVRTSGIDVSSVRIGLFDPVDPDGKVVPLPRRSSMLGMTESFGPHGVEHVETIMPEQRARSAGHALEGIERKIVDPETRQTLPAGQVGELMIRGFSLMQGYYKRERSEIFDPDGWFATGDLCRFDADGYIYYQSRRSEMIKTSGANVAPMEIEVLMQGYENVMEAIVFGLPDEVKGERVAAVLIAKEGRIIDVDAVRQRLKNDLSTYKVPTDIFILPHADIPRTDTGKVRKPVLKEFLMNNSMVKK